MAFLSFVDLTATIPNVYSKVPAAQAAIVNAKSAAVSGLNQGALAVASRPRTAFGVILASMTAATVARFVAKRRELARQAEQAAAKTARARVVAFFKAIAQFLAIPFVYGFNSIRNRLFPQPQNKVERAKDAVKAAANKAINAKDAVAAKVKAVVARNPHAAAELAITFGFLAARTMHNHVVPAVSSAASTLAAKAGEFSRRNIRRPA